jgi:hypothetical protein
MLGTLLPKIRNAFHDRSEKVRVAFVALLKKTSTIKSIKVLQTI